MWVVVAFLCCRKIAVSCWFSISVTTVTIWYAYWISYSSWIIFVARCYASAAYAVMWCVSVTFVHSVKTNKHIFKIFSPLGSHTILVFTYQTAWQYSDGRPLTGIKCDSEAIIIIIKNVKIRVTLSWVTLQGHFTELLKLQTKWSAAGEWSQCHASVSSNSHVFKRLRKERSGNMWLHCMLWSIPAASAIYLAATDHGKFITLVAGECPSLLMVGNNHKVWQETSTLRWKQRYAVVNLKPR